MIQELKIDPLIHWRIEPQLVGNEQRWDITFDSGPYTMLDKLQALGKTTAIANVEPILHRVKDEMQRLQRVLTDDEVRAIADAVERERLAAGA